MLPLEKKKEEKSHAKECKQIEKLRILLIVFICDCTDYVILR